MDLRFYSKLTAGIAGNVVGLILVYFATKGIGHCGDISDVGTCSVVGVSYAQINAVVMIVLNAIFIHQSPANKVNLPDGRQV